MRGGGGLTPALASISSTNGLWSFPSASVDTEVPFSLPPASHEVTICRENWYVTCSVVHNMGALHSYHFCYWLKTYLTHLSMQTFSAKNQIRIVVVCQQKVSTENMFSAISESLENNSFNKKKK